MYDQRVFRDQNTDRWWIAQVLSTGSVGWGDGPHPPSEEGLYFTELGERDAPSLTTVLRPPGWLHRYSHSSILHLLQRATPTDSNVPLRPTNVPNAAEFQVEPLVDAEGLRWVYRRRALPMYSPHGPAVIENSVEFVCLDDSALRGTVRMSDATTLDDLLHTIGDSGLLPLVEAVKSTFQQLSPAAP